MTYRIDRTPSFFGEESYHTLFSLEKPIEIQSNSCFFSRFFKKIINFCSRKPEKLNEELQSTLIHLRSKYKSTIVCSTFCSNRRTESSPNTGIIHQKESFLDCYHNNFPINRFFILEHYPFNLIANFHEKKFENHEKTHKLFDLEEFMIDKLGGYLNEFGLVLNFQISDFVNNTSFCKKIQNSNKTVINMDYREYSKSKLQNFYEHSNINHEVNEIDSSSYFDTVKTDYFVERKSKLKADISIINALHFKYKQPFLKNSQEKLKKVLVKILSQAIYLSDSIILLINKEISLINIPEIFEKAVNSCLRFEPLSTSIEITKIENDSENYMIFYSPHNIKKAQEEIKYLFSHIYPNKLELLEFEQKNKLKEIFLKNRIRLLKQIIINHNKKPEHIKEKIDLIEIILKVLIEYQIISSSFIKNHFPNHEKLIKELNSPMLMKQKYLKSLENSLIREDSFESIQYVEENAENMLNNITNSRYPAHTVHYDEGTKFEFSSYTSYINDQSTITRKSSMGKINSLEARLDYLNLSMMNNQNPTLNFKKYIMESENAVLKNHIIISKKFKKKKNPWKSSF